MAQEHKQKSTKGQKPDLNEIQPGMEVEDTTHELGEGDISKPRISNVIRDKQGQVQYVLIGKGPLFKKMVLVPANRIKEVRREPEDKKGPGKVVIETTPEDEQELKKRGLDILSDIEKGDLIAEVEEAMPTAEGLEALETESEQEESKQPQPSEDTGEQEGPHEHAAHPRLLQIVHDIGPGFLAGIPAAFFLWYITVFSNFNLVKKIFIVMSAAFITYIITAFVSGADWKTVLISSFVPQINFNFANISAALALLGATISPYSMYWQMRAEVEEKRTGTMKQQFRVTSIDVASGTIGGNLVAYFIIITTASTLFVHHQSIQTAADAANALGPLVGPFAKYLFAIGLIGAALIAIPIMSASSAYAVADTFGWPAGLSEQPWQAEGFYIVLTASLLVGQAFALLHIDPIKLIFYANVFTGVLAPIMVIYLLAIGNSRKIMGEYKLGWLTNFFLALTALVLVIGSVLFFYGLATGQGGS